MRKLFASFLKGGEVGDLLRHEAPVSFREVGEVEQAGLLSDDE